MKNKFWIILCLFIVFLLCLGLYFFFKNNSTNSTTEYDANRTSSVANNSTETNTGEQSTNQSDVSESENSDNTIQETPPPSTNTDSSPKVTEETISTYTTNIYSSDNARQNNIKITCDTLNNTIVKAGETFSFCNTVGKATSSKGYQEADIFDNKGNKKKGIGGGICQVSSTLYNSVLNLDSLAVIERHSHSNKVPYVKSGKDAAVAHRKL